MYDPRELIGILERQELSVGESMDDRGNPIYWITGRDGMLGPSIPNKFNFPRLEERKKENNL
ncbi:MAG: hypothetical protein QOE55_7837 [Acidobacteriaceae bacterium]|jgi:hypothetical protein|nr:hypothetical protein [Acidobacteriaceae bacterium]